MKFFALLMLPGCFLLMLVGCAAPHLQQSDLPDARIESARYEFGSRDYVSIRGEFFKEQSDLPIDVIASTNGRDWLASKKIAESSGVKYRAILPYGPDFPHVWVRVYGLNGKYSEAFLIPVQ